MKEKENRFQIKIKKQIRKFKTKFKTKDDIKLISEIENMKANL